MKIKPMLLVFLGMYFAVSPCVADECGGSSAGSGLAASNTALIVWAKTIDDTSTFPSWASTLPSTFVDFFSVMSYDQHTIIPKIATKNGDFYVSDAGHSVDYYKTTFASLPTGHHYLGPYGIFVEEILNKVENDYGADYFDDVDMITMMLTNGGDAWYLPSGNFTGGVHIGIVRSGNPGLATIDDCTIQKFTEKGVYLDNSSATMQNCTITGRITASHGIYATGDNSNPTIINNTISGVHIGIVRSGNPGLATIHSCTIQDFTEKGVYLDNSSATMQNCTITGGINASHGIHATGDNSNPTIINNTIKWCAHWNRAQRQCRPGDHR